MHVDWSCYALILLEDEPSKRSLFLYRAHSDFLAEDKWRLPGGARIAGETDPRQTLNRTVQAETGFDILSKSHVPLIASNERSVKRISSFPKAKSYTASVRYYAIRRTSDEYLDRVNFEIPQGGFLEPKLESWCLESGEIYEPHAEIIRAYLNLPQTHK